MNDQIRKLQDEVITKAVKLINRDELADKLAQKMKGDIEEAFQHEIGEIDFSYWITSELQDETTVAGKAFAKAMDKIAKAMVKAI